MEDTTNQDTFIVPLVSGGLAGIAVDISLYPIDTLKVSVLLPLFLFFVNLFFLTSFQPAFPLYSQKNLKDKTTSARRFS